MSIKNVNNIATKSFYVYVGVASVAVLNLFPVLTGALVELLEFPVDAAVNVPSMNLLGLAIAALVGFFTLHRWSLRATTAAGAIITIAAQVASMQSATALLAAKAASIQSPSIVALATQAASLQSSTADLMMILQLASGIGCGLMLVSTLALLSHFTDADAILGMAFFTQMLFLIVGTQFAPAILSAWSVAGLFGLCAVIAVPILLFIRLMPNKQTMSNIKSTDETSSLRSIISVGAVLVLLALLLTYASNTALFAFQTVIGATKGFEENVALDALGLAAVSSMVIALIISVVGSRFGRAVPLIVGLSVMIVAFLLLENSSSALILTLGTCLLLGSLSICLPYMVGLLVDFDPSGRLVSSANFVVFLGAATGPIIGGGFIRGEAGDDFSLLTNVSVACIVVAIASLLFVIRQQSPKRLELATA